MDFFAEQERALKRSRGLFLIFILCVIGVVAVVYLLAASFLVVEGQDGRATIPLYRDENYSAQDFWKKPWFHPELFMAVSLFVGGTIAIATFWKSRELTAGGAAHVAQSMGGVEVMPDTRNFREIVLRNVVEEMALAAGHPTPRIFVLPGEAAINAFAAATSPRDIVVGVTRGALEKLSREELQGVMAHEMSHLVHGDSRLNVQMISLVFGILALTIMGRILIEIGFRSSRGRGGFSLMLALFVTGMTLIVVGYVSVFFGRILQAAINRQREYLADAAAVQYTRQTEGIAGALKKVGGFSSKARLSGHAQDSAHMMFADPITHWFGNLLASHPPLHLRIKKLDPSFTGEIDRKKFTPAISREDAMALGFSDKQGPTSSDSQPSQVMPAAMPLAQFEGEMVLPRSRHLYYVRAMSQGFHPVLREAVTHPAGASAVCFLLVCSREPTTAKNQMDLIATKAAKSVLLEMGRLRAFVEDLPREKYLCLADLAVPGLRGMSPNQAKSFVELLDELAGMDGITDLLEFALQQMMRRHLLAYHRLIPPAVIRHRPPAALLAREYGLVFSALAHADCANDEEARVAFQAALGGVDYIAGTPVFFSRQECTWPALHAALDELGAASPIIKKNVLFCAAQVVLSNQNTSLQEWELIRAFADAIDSPLPPLLIQQ